jgi:acyl-CoA synthetase (NDP forming)
MINKQLLEPKNIAIVGGSNDINKPGGKIVKNILDGNYKGELFVINRKEKEVQGIKCVTHVSELPDVELAILAIPAQPSFVLSLLRFWRHRKIPKLSLLFQQALVNTVKKVPL